MVPLSTPDGAAQNPVLQMLRSCLKCLAVFAVGICFLLLAIGIWSYRFMETPSFDLQRMEQIELGMTKDEVRKILGEPHSDFGNSWAWSTGWPIVYVYFDAEGRYREWVYDR